jgi:hypothetical protein
MTTISNLNYLALTNSTSAFYQNTDTDSIIFEFTAVNINASLQVYPLFETLTTVGFSNVSAVSQIDISSAGLSKLFFFEGTNDVITPLRYGINTGFNFNFSYSSSIIKSGSINTNGSQKLSNDYVRYLANAITGGYNLADIFSNETLLISGVDSMNTSFNNILNKSLVDLSNSSTSTSSLDTIYTDASYIIYSDICSNSMNTYLTSTKQLLDGLLSISNTPRGQQFIQDISSQYNSINVSNVSTNVSTSYYYIPFRHNDKLSIVLNYVPLYGNGNAYQPLTETTSVGINPIYTRSYKVILNCVN